MNRQQRAAWRRLQALEAGEFKDELDEVLMQKPEAMRVKHTMEAMDKAIGQTDLEIFLAGKDVALGEQDMLREVIKTNLKLLRAQANR